MRILKYTLQITDFQVIDLPENCQILTVQMQHGKPQLWVLADREHIKKQKVIQIIGTGHEIPITNIARYISTFQMENGYLVFHVFENYNK
jgi:hypothetical protein